MLSISMLLQRSPSVSSSWCNHRLHPDPGLLVIQQNGQMTAEPFSVIQSSGFYQQRAIKERSTGVDEPDTLLSAILAGESNSTPETPEKKSSLF